MRACVRACVHYRFSSSFLSLSATITPNPQPSERAATDPQKPISSHPIPKPPHTHPHISTNSSGRYAHLLKADVPRFHTARTDLDNLVKLVLDSLNEHAYEDDRQVYMCVICDVVGM